MKPTDEMLDDEWRKIVKRLNPFCWFPGCGQSSTDACHIQRRSHFRTRWLINNGLGGCRKHHSWEETHPDEAEKMLRAKIGSRMYDLLERMANEETHYTESDKKEILLALRQEVKSLSNG